MYFLANGSDPLLLHFALSIIEFWALHRWHSIALDERVRLRDGISHYILEASAAQANAAAVDGTAKSVANRANTVERYVLNKAVKVYVSIGKVEWPHDNPDFFATVSAVAQRSETAALGVYMLRAISEDFAAPVDSDVTSARKRQLLQLLQNEAPNIIAYLASLLSSLLTSPTQWRGDALATAQAALDTLSHYASWLPLDVIVRASNVLFDALLGVLRMSRVAGGK